MTPIHITFTGIDAATCPAEVVALSRDYPIEWGILFHPTQQGTGRFPPLADLERFVGHDMRLAAHLCGGYARDVIGGGSLHVDIVRLLGRFGRIQVNSAARGIEPAAVARFTARFGAHAILQCRGTERFPEDEHVDWLFDRSGGKGRLAEYWPVPGSTARIVGYAGGLGPDTVATALATITEKHPPVVPFWIDMERALRTDDVLDLGKCRTVCEIVYG